MEVAGRRGSWRASPRELALWDPVALRSERPSFPQTLYPLCLTQSDFLALRSILRYPSPESGHGQPPPQPASTARGTSSSQVGRSGHPPFPSPQTLNPPGLTQFGCLIEANREPIYRPPDIKRWCSVQDVKIDWGEHWIVAEDRIYNPIDWLVVVCDDKLLLVDLSMRIANYPNLTATCITIDNCPDPTATFRVFHLDFSVEPAKFLPPANRLPSARYNPSASRFAPRHIAPAPSACPTYGRSPASNADVGSLPPRACYKVRCLDHNICSRRAVTVIITDEFPGGICPPELTFCATDRRPEGLVPRRKMRRPEKLRVLRHLAEIDNRRPPLFFIPKIAHPPASRVVRAAAQRACACAWRSTMPPKLIHVMSRTLHDAGIRHALHDTGVRREAFVTPSTTRSFALAIRVPAPGDAFPVTIRHARAGGGQITTPMAPVAPLPLFASDRDIQSSAAPSPYGSTPARFSSSPLAGFSRADQVDPDRTTLAGGEGADLLLAGNHRSSYGCAGSQSCSKALI
ncbi:hypothetical protein HU200_021464 [Digitaria exilis]|uniref:Expansin-like EG45 domain-containing protein n=1 Tax=Digitaria exilis TaxID=1010633 RepID=A0A835KBS2_9POAL|nr:hypothetical protein HU200_021464 [Digitaria exilis]